MSRIGVNAYQPYLILMKICLPIIKILPVIVVFLIPLSFFAQVSGSVFRDINNDGIRQSINPTEPGEFGITVKAYNAVNTLLGTATTDANGSYSFTAAQISSGLAVRLEFITAAGDYPSKRISANRSNVQFVVSGAAAINIDYAIASKKMLSDNSNPYVATTAYVNGDANVTSGTNAPGKYNSLYVFPYDLSNDGGSSRRTKNQYTGSVFGLAWQKESRTLFMAAYLKRHAGFGPHGIGAIYQSQIDKIGIPSNPTLLVDVSTIGINVGTNPRTGSLPADASAPNTDDGVFANVGKTGIGGIELSDDGRDLYIVNMYEKKLHRINIGNPLKSSFSTTDVTGNWVIPDPGIPGTVWHPMALKIHDHKFYIGGVCVKETTGLHNIADTTNMKGVVYEFNPSTNVFTEVLRFPFTYRKGYSNADYKYEFRNNYWSAWQNNGDISYTGPLRTGLVYNPLSTPVAWATALYYGQPMFSAIEFDVDGSMIIGIRDRFGDQGGYANYFETGNVPGETYRTLASGEILRAGKNGSTWVFENDGSVTTNGVTTTTPGVTDNNTPMTGSFSGATGTAWGGIYGPGGGYYYYNFNYTLTGVPAPFNSVAANTAHYLKSNGGLAYLPGYNEVMTSAIDPMNTAYSNGLIKNVNTGVQAGNMAARMNLIVNPSGDPANMGKAASLGDLEILYDAEAMEIGNLVWEDANANGRQDAGESGIANVTVVLRSPGADGIYNNGDDQTWMITTDANGNYYFDAGIVNDNRRPLSWLGVSSTNSGILPGFEYRIEIDPSQTTLTGLTLTPVNYTTNLSINNDGALSAGKVEYVVNPGGSTAAASSFENNYNIDFGFYSIVLSLKQIDLAVDNQVNNTIGIKWNTKDELDVSKYQPQRSIDGVNFQNVQFAVPSKGNGSYSYFIGDNISELKASNLYYRIKIINANGKFEYSNVVRINLEEAMNFQLGPNPSESYMYIQVAAKENSLGNLRITNMTGDLVYNRNYYFTRGSNKITINEFSNYPRGAYVIQLKCGDKKFTRTAIKK